MKINRIHFLYLLLFSLLWSCDTDTDPANIEDLSPEKQIVQMSFLIVDNESLINDVFTEINEQTGMITAELPIGANILSLIPNTVISENATVEPMDGNDLDFSNPVNFIVTAEDGTQKTYTVSLKQNSKKRITKFYFSHSDNTGLDADVIGNIDEFNKVIIVDLPLEAQIKGLYPTIEIEGKEVNPQSLTEIDFSDLKTFTVMADDGSSQDYTISVSYDRYVLIKFGEVNDLFSRQWSLASNHEYWLGVEVGDFNRVIGLGGFNQCFCIEKLIPELGLLVKLKYLSIGQYEHRYEGTINNFPPELGNLSNLENLSLRFFELGDLPPEIGKLTKLKHLLLDFNNISIVPNELGNLVELERLWLSNNFIETIPNEIGQLTKIYQMRLGHNKLINIPSSIGNLIELDILQLSENEITAIPKEMGNLSKLRILTFLTNKLTSIPKELGNLTNLESLELIQNNLTSIPQEVCDLQTNYNTFIQVDEGVYCE